MKTIVILLSTILATIGLMAEGGPPPHTDSQARTATAASDDLAALDQFLAMDDAKLDQLQQAITRVRAMTPTERANLRHQIAEYRRLSSEQREKVRAGWGWLNDSDRNDWPQMMHSLPDAGRAAIQSEIQALPPEQRAIRKHALLESWRAKQKAAP
jgi:hypothetical protein